MPHRLALSAIALSLCTSVVSALAADFKLAELPESRNPYELNNGEQSCNGGTYYEFLHKIISKKMLSLARHPTHISNEEALKMGEGVAVKLDDSNYNFHINFPAGAQGGRSYGWTEGKVGDWSDKMYLDNLAKVATQESREDLGHLYKAIIHLLGSCNATGLKKLSNNSQRVATNFLAIYTAEQYRAIVGTPNWDDALLQTTLLAAFHGGQSELVKFYEGKFTGSAYDQSACAYKRSKSDTQKRPALLNDYWQFGKTATLDPESGRCKGRSGINLTRRDFELLGAAITRYEARQSNKNLADIRKIVGSGSNVFAAITTYFVSGRATAEKTTKLAHAISQFALDIYDHADEITEWEQNGEQG
jgi:hypothetical protein